MSIFGKIQLGQITQRSIGRQKPGRFLTIGKFIGYQGPYFKRKSFFAFAACEFNVIRL